MEDEMVERHHPFERYEFEQALEVGDGQGGSRAAAHAVTETRT